MKKKYFPNLNGLRFIAAFIVMLYHFFDYQFFNGPRAVILFFVLSGFLISYFLFEEKEKNSVVNIKSFYLRRTLRIWPLYFFVLMIASVIYLNSGNSFFEYLETIVYYILFLPNFAFVIHHTLQYASILWSIGSEEQFYLIWPWIFKQEMEQILKGFVLIYIIFLFTPHLVDFINIRYFEVNNNLMYTSRFIQSMNFGSMAVGGILAYIGKFKKEYLKYFYNKIVQIVTFVIIVVLFGFEFGNIWVDQLYSLLFGVLIINSALNPKVIVSFENKIFNYLGKISFGLYMYHLLAFGMVKYILNLAGIYFFFPKVVVFVLGFILTVIFSSLSYFYFEKRFLSIKNKKLSIFK